MSEDIKNECISTLTILGFTKLISPRDSKNISYTNDRIIYTFYGTHVRVKEAMNNCIYRVHYPSIEDTIHRQVRKYKFIATLYLYGFILGDPVLGERTIRLHTDIWIIHVGNRRTKIYNKITGKGVTTDYKNGLNYLKKRL